MRKAYDIEQKYHEQLEYIHEERIEFRLSVIYQSHQAKSTVINEFITINSKLTKAKPYVRSAIVGTTGHRLSDRVNNDRYSVSAITVVATPIVAGTFILTPPTW